MNFVTTGSNKTKDHSLSLSMENLPEEYVDISYDDAQRRDDYSHACHCMIYAVLQEKVFGIYSPRAAVLMQMRFDGYLGFPGGLVEIGENLEVGLNREMKEEVGLDLEVYHINKDDHVMSQINKNKKLCFHFYVKEVTYEEFVDIEMEVLKANNYGNEVLGIIRVPLFTMSDGYGGLPAFLGQKFAGNARNQLLFTLQHVNILSEQEIHEALYNHVNK